MRLLSSLERPFDSDMVGICLVQFVVLVPVFVCSDGCLQEPTKPSFLWKRWSPLLGSVAVRVSGRFNTCYRINFHFRENQDSIWRCASFASEFGLSRLACHGACRRVLVHLKSLDCDDRFSKVLRGWCKGGLNYLELLVLVDYWCSCMDLYGFVLMSCDDFEESSLVNACNQCSFM